MSPTRQWGAIGDGVDGSGQGSGVREFVPPWDVRLGVAGVLTAALGLAARETDRLTRGGVAIPETSSQTGVIPTGGRKGASPSLRRRTYSLDVNTASATMDVSALPTSFVTRRSSASRSASPDYSTHDTRAHARTRYVGEVRYDTPKLHSELSVPRAGFFSWSRVLDTPNSSSSPPSFHHSRLPTRHPIIRIKSAQCTTA